jgi:hypothetical protein
MPTGVYGPPHLRCLSLHTSSSCTHHPRNCRALTSPCLLTSTELLTTDTCACSSRFQRPSFSSQIQRTAASWLSTKRTTHLQHLRLQLVGSNFLLTPTARNYSCLLACTRYCTSHRQQLHLLLASGFKVPPQPHNYSANYSAQIFLPPNWPLLKLLSSQLKRTRTNYSCLQSTETTPHLQHLRLQLGRSQLLCSHALRGVAGGHVGSVLCARSLQLLCQLHH